MAIEVVDSGVQYEAFIHCVTDRANAYDYYHEIDRPDIEAVKGLEFGDDEIIKSMAWVDLSERARLNISHDDNPLLQRFQEGGTP